MRMCLFICPSNTLSEMAILCLDFEPHVLIAKSPESISSACLFLAGVIFGRLDHGPWRSLTAGNWYLEKVPKKIFLALIETCLAGKTET